jgi:N-carbamoylputrescine amidase
MRSVRLALAQLSATEDRRENLRKVLGFMRTAADGGANMVVFPELVMDRFFPQHRGLEEARDLAEPIPGPSTDAVSALAAELSLVTVFNLYEVDDRGRYFDSSPVFDADGALLGVTRMTHITQYPRFYEQDYYHPGDRGAPVFATGAGRIGVAICYDRHYPEYMRALGVAEAELVLIPQAGVVGEWPEGMFEAEVRAAAFQNGYFAGLCHRVGQEEELVFSGDSFVCDPEGRLLARGAHCREDLLFAELDLSLAERSTARRLFWRHRRAELYSDWLE